jgi:putative endonuclease
MPWTVYIARCADGSLYTGITTDPDRRLAEHNRGAGGAYTRSRLPVAMVYLEVTASRSEALRRELDIKRLSPGKKKALASDGEGTSILDGGTVNATRS